MLTILWDNDGVLVDTERFYFRACQTVLGSIGLSLTAEQFKEISLRRGESVFTLAAEQGVDENQITSLRAERDRLYAELLRDEHCAVEGAEEVLRSLHGRFRMGVVTGSRREHFEIAHAKCRMTEYFDFVIAHGDYSRSKPYPDAYLAALERHNIQPADCMVVEDSERGLAAAVTAGLQCVIVRSEWTKEADLCNACKVVESIREVPEVIERWAARRSQEEGRPH